MASFSSVTSPWIIGDLSPEYGGGQNGGCSGSRPSEPDLRIGPASAQTVRCRYLIGIDLIITALGIDEDKLVRILPLQEGGDVALIDLIAPSGEFLFGISGTGCACLYGYRVSSLRHAGRIRYSPSTRIGNSSACRVSKGEMGTRYSPVQHAVQ